MHDAGAAAKVVILDACRTVSVAARGGARGLATYDGRIDALIAYAAAVGQVADDNPRERNGLYTKHLLEHLGTAGLSMYQILSRTAESVRTARPQGQLPELRSLAADIRLSEMPLLPARSPDEAAALWSSLQGADDCAFEAYLRRFPSGPMATEARRHFEACQQGRPSDPAKVATAPPSTTTIQRAARPGSIVSMAPGLSFRDCNACPEMVVIPAGSFMMGGSGEDPQHAVTISRQLAAGRYEVTFDEWEVCVREGGCGYQPHDQGWGRGRRPVISVSWSDAKQYTNWLSKKTGKNYRLLTEAEWEYAARAGTTSRYFWGDEIGRNNANCDGCGSQWDRRQTAPVGSFKPNAFGLYDVHGNVWEWTEDCWNANYNGAPRDGSAWTAGECSRRVLRGGAWNYSPQHARSVHRLRNGSGSRGYYFGLRVSRTL